MRNGLISFLVCRMRGIIVAGIILMCILLPCYYSADASCDQIEDSFSLKLTDSNGNDLSDPLFGGDVVVFFDTYDTGYGTIFKLKAMLSIRTIPANLVINASGGLFKLAVSASGMGSFLDETGMRITINNGEDTYNADLRKNNNFSAEFRNGGNIAALDPNVNYSVSVCLIDSYESTVPPESVKDIKITFQAIASDGFHQVMFISQDEAVESYMAFDNYVIEEVPSVSRSGYSFKGWYTLDGKEITNGYVISPNDGDIIAYAEWEKNENSILPIALGIGGGSALLLGLVVLVALKRKHGGEGDTV